MVSRRRLWIMAVLVCVLSLSILSVPWAEAVTYPPVSGSNTFEWITRVIFYDTGAGIDNSTGQESDGYGDHTYDKSSQVAFVRPGTVGGYPFSVVIQPDYTFCQEYVSAFFDWNRNGSFTEPGEEVAVVADTCSIGAHASSVSVPADALPGETRMRVVLKQGATPPSQDDIKWGEAEDYTIIVLYPSIVSSDNTFEWISNVTLGDINNSTGQEATGYGDYTYWKSGTITDVFQGKVYPLSVTINAHGQEFVNAFFDWNHDGDFGDAGESVTVIPGYDESGLFTRTVNVRVPGGAVPGTTQMRVALKYYSTPPSTGGLGTGEAEDYTINVNPTFPWPMILPSIIKQHLP